MAEKIKILYVEDNRENRLLVRREETISKSLPNLILMDINLPEIDGYTLTSRLRQNPRLFEVPIIAMTANVMKGDRERTLEAGCDGYIQKPIDVDLLGQQLRRFLKRGEQ
jgi:two-component system cell cycle response regulator DivK